MQGLGFHNDYMKTPSGVACLFCLTCFVILPLIAAVAAYLAFGIIFIIDDVDVCSYQSPLWIFAVTAMVYPCALSCAPLIHYALKPAGGTDSLRYLISFFIIQAPFIIYGLYILYSGVVCDNMHDTGLWIWAEVTVYASLGYACILLILIIAGLTGLFDLEPATPFGQTGSEWHGHTATAEPIKKGGDMEHGAKKGEEAPLMGAQKQPEGTKAKPHAEPTADKKD